MNALNKPDIIAGQLSSEERRIILAAVLEATTKPEVILEVGTWLGGGSTLHFLRALHQNGTGHLWGIEADPSIYTQMLKNIESAVPEAAHRFTPLLGMSHHVIPQWLMQSGAKQKVDIVFLDGGNNPAEQITEFKLLDPHIPIGGQLLAHDAKMRKGRWLVPYLCRLDNWDTKVHDSENGLLQARKIGDAPSPSSRKAATMCLLRMRCNPVEIAATLLPAKMCKVILALLPRNIAYQLSEGPNEITDQH